MGSPVQIFAVVPKPNKAEDALKDTDQCITLQRSWPNGYSRRGSAKYALGRYADAYHKDGLSHEASIIDSFMHYLVIHNNFCFRKKEVRRN